MKREVILPVFPLRIISLVPSLTELLYDLDLNERVVGITKFCVHPHEWYQTKTRVGGTKKLNLGEIRALQPDLIIGNKEENNRSDIEELEKEFPVWLSDIETFDQAIACISEISRITNSEEEGERIVADILKEKDAFVPGSRRKVLYLIWRNPWMAVGANTFIDELLSICNLENVVKEPRYVNLTDQQIAALNPDLLYLSSEPFPFKEKHAGQIRQILPDAEIQLVDGEMFSWYGSRLTQAFRYLSEISS